ATAEHPTAKQTRGVRRDVGKHMRKERARKRVKHQSRQYKRNCPAKELLPWKATANGPHEQTGQGKADSKQDESAFPVSGVKQPLAEQSQNYSSSDPHRKPVDQESLVHNMNTNSCSCNQAGEVKQKMMVRRPRVGLFIT